ncbi:MAG: beta-ketoacyl-ACP synthase [Alphaproteobacteria bacterium]|nr:beta-ketoacyl-ACP synthase [Alphaproteobacteria bacterium]
MAHDVVLTGYGLLCAAGETPEAWWRALSSSDPLHACVDSETYKPFHVYPIVDYDLTAQVPKKGDQRAMGPMMQYGAYACGLALEAAGIKGDEELLGRIELIGAAGGGERDWEVDANVLDLLEREAEPGAELNRMLSDDLRPTLFLAQLPNLFGGNISIVHGVAGATRTFMGEESAGMDAFRVAFERARAGQGELFLVGAAFNANRPDLHVMYDGGGLLLTEPLTPVWDRPDAGICLGSAGAFFVLETADHAAARGVRPLAKVKAVASDRCRRAPGAAAENAWRQLDAVWSELRGGALAVMSGACGSGALAREEHELLTRLVDSGVDCAVRGTAAALGHTVEASFLANTVLGVSCLERGTVFPPMAASDPLEQRMADGNIEQVLVTGWGAFRGEGMALLEVAD